MKHQMLRAAGRVALCGWSIPAVRHCLTTFNTMKYSVIQRWFLSLCLCWAGAQTIVAQASWAANPADYQFSMNIVAQLQIGGQPVNTTGNAIGAFHHSEVRGSAATIVWSGQARYFLTVYSNTYAGDSIVFRAFLTANNQLYEAADTLVFFHQKVLGTLNDPFVLELAPSERPFITSAGTAGFTELVCASDSLLDIQATDNQDSEGNGLVYSLSGGPDAGKFAIDPQTGVLSWLNFYPDFENPADADANNRYEVQVTVTDLGGRTDVQTLKITVSDNPPPQITCPPDMTVGTGSDNNNGVCAATISGAGVTGLSDDCAFSLAHTLSGATAASDSGQIAANRLFYPGLTTATCIAAAKEPGGVQDTCVFTVAVSDDQAPTFNCPANATRNAAYAGSNCQYTIDGAELDATAIDDCNTAIYSNNINSGTTLAGLVLAMNTVTSVTWTASDAAGNLSTCAYTITVTNCNIILSGAIKWKNDPGQGVNTTTVALTGSATASMLTGTSGTYSLATTLTTGSFTVTPTKNLNKLNGVTSADATAIQQHVANINLITDPYKLVAADVNKSNTISSQDASIVTQALLGNPAALNQFKDSWRFVPTSHTMAVPPWGFPEKRTYTNINANQSNQDFYGMKIGDVVTAFANPANFGGDADLVLHLQDRMLQTGEQFSLECRADQIDNIAAWQFALRFDPALLQLIKVQPLAALSLDADNFGTHQADQGEIRSVWSAAEGVDMDDGLPLFVLQFSVLQGGAMLSEVLGMEEADLPARVYTSTFAESEVRLVFDDMSGTGGNVAPAYALMQNVPNPFSDKTVLSFELPEACAASLRVFDASGRLLYTRVAQYPAGTHFEVFDRHETGGGGVFFCELRTPFGIQTRKMLALKRS